MSTYHALRAGVFLPPFHRISARRKAASARHFAVEEAAKTRDVAK
jgi:hypothetical protein